MYLKFAVNILSTVVTACLKNKSGVHWCFTSMSERARACAHTHTNYVCQSVSQSPSHSCTCAHTLTFPPGSNSTLGLFPFLLHLIWQDARRYKTLWSLTSLMSWKPRFTFGWKPELSAAVEHVPVGETAGPSGYVPTGACGFLPFFLYCTAVCLGLRVKICACFKMGNRGSP